jgi:HAE1 family hydrophobic/amphiphilic exporter-1
MMTTMAALMAALPLAVAAGSDSRRQLGLTAVGGLLISQLVTLYLTPVVFLYMDALQRKAKELPAWLRGAFGNGRRPAEA